MDASRRLLTDEEIPYLDALGAELRTVREALRLSRPELSRRTGLLVSRHTIERIETGIRRTRASTLYLIAQALVDAAEDPPMTAEELVEHFLSLGSIAVAPESQHYERVARRRQRRLEKERKLNARAEAMARGMVREVARKMASEYIEGWRWVNNYPTRSTVEQRRQRRRAIAPYVQAPNTQRQARG